MRKIIKLISVLLLLLATASFISCKKNNSLSVRPVEDTIQVPVHDSIVYHYTSELPYNLNVVYFVAADHDTNADYHRRLSEMMLQLQGFYRQWMNHWGFSDKSFGLLKDKEHNRIKISVIQGSHPQGYYDYSTGSGHVIDEVNAYYVQHADEKTSDHYLVIMAVKDIQQDNAPSYGLGNHCCFALDYPCMDVIDLDKDVTRGISAITWIGGLAHELGHGLNLPHNGGTLSENHQFGTTLMGAGNSTYGRYPTFLTLAECAILNNCQVFGTLQRNDWYTTKDTKVKHLHAIYDGTNIIVSGKFSSNIPVNYINFYNDGGVNGIGGNKDYDAVAWATKPIDQDSFYIKMPFNEFTNKADFPYELRIIFSNENGSLAVVSYSYAIENGQPVIDFGDKPQYDKADWHVIDFSSEETVSEPGEASNIIDGDNSTSWVTRWSSNAPAFPHYFVVDMGQQLQVNRFTFVQRTGSSKSKDVEVFVSSDTVNWRSEGQYILPDLSGPSDIHLTANKTFRYFKVVVTSATDGRHYASLAEVSNYLDH